MVGGGGRRGDGLWMRETTASESGFLRAIVLLLVQGLHQRTRDLRLGRADGRNSSRALAGIRVEGFEAPAW